MVSVESLRAGVRLVPAALRDVVFYVAALALLSLAAWKWTATRLTPWWPVRWERLGVMLCAITLVLVSIGQGWAIASRGVRFPGVLPVITTVLLGPLAEEWCYRGVCMRTAAHRGTWPLAIAVSATLFTLFHVSLLQPTEVVAFLLGGQWIGHLLLGLLLGGIDSPSAVSRFPSLCMRCRTC